MKNKQHIALVTTWYPPKQSVATNRMLAFATILANDFCVTVFALDEKTHTVKEHDNLYVRYSKSKSIFDYLENKTTDSRSIHFLKTGIKVILAKVVKNPLKKWQKRTTKDLIQTHQQSPFDLIISSFAPQETHLAVAAFKKHYSNVPWIADMRDEMSKNPDISSKTRNALIQVEQYVNSYANAITTVSSPILNDFKTICPKVTHFKEIRNGYNHELTPLTHQNKVFTFGYFGSFYGGRKPVIFFKALQHILDKNKDFEFKFVIVGAHKNFEIPAQVEKFVEIRPIQPYLEAVKMMMQMDMNVIIQPRSQRKGVFSGKLFDYISAARPVLAMVDKDDVAAKMILDFDAGYVAECDDLDENICAIEKAFDDWKSGIVKKASEENRLSLHRKNQVNELKLLINTILS